MTADSHTEQHSSAPEMTCFSAKHVQAKPTRRSRRFRGWRDDSFVDNFRRAVSKASCADEATEVFRQRKKLYFHLSIALLSFHEKMNHGAVTLNFRNHRSITYLTLNPGEKNIDKRKNFFHQAQHPSTNHFIHSCCHVLTTTTVVTARCCVCGYRHA